MDAARSFFGDMKFPPDFFRSAIPTGGDGSDDIFRMHPFLPGGNVDGLVNNFVVDPASATFDTPCVLYDDILNTVKGLYPNPTGVLRRNLIKNLGYFYSGFTNVISNGCPEQFPYGRE
jgi:hypothetical protein